MLQVHKAAQILLRIPRAKFIVLLLCLFCLPKSVRAEMDLTAFKTLFKTYLGWWV